MDVLEHILQSPVAFALLLGVAVLMLNRWLDKAKEEIARERSATASAIAAAYAQNAAALKLIMDERKLAEAAAEKREKECIARVQELEKRHVDYIETKADKMTEALLLAARATESSVAASNNLAAVVERNSATTERLTEAYRKTPLTDA